ncbi:sensor protein RstB [Massilia sp. WF1]|uniref:ATP-binding protein n=1 Tax=unclassified Massilia TaxID=2609279 RepID=UPI00064B01DA|nr:MULTISPECIES: ATP-binding protein [unclassified Massilia]ALK96300.1 sensor protein RstB [Massilia sp. WG5]KLU37713.1 sensor protein RstB [Massilia sp. WF1]
MNRLFFRFFILVMLSITAATFVVYFVFARLFGDPLDDIARRQASAQIFLLEHYVDQAPADEWLGRLNKVREVSTVHFDLIPLDEARSALPRGAQAAFERGEIVLDPGRKTFFRRVDLGGERYIGSNEDAIRASRLPVDLGQALLMEVVRYVVVALALLVPIALWSRSHWQGLQMLARVTDEFGAGKLSARAVMKPSDAAYPLAQRINAMAERIQGLLESQKNLLHSVSHELRTPIARLEFALELLSERANDPALSKRIAAMDGDLAELNELVNELLSMSKLDNASEPQRALFEVEPVLRECADGLHPRPAALHVELGTMLGSVDGDRRLLARAVGNLLRNAQKYAAGTVALSAYRDGGLLEILVDDDGPGIPEEERERIFEPFYRLDRSRDRATGGFGLGLSIARKAVMLHGGILRVERSPLGGARFAISLPDGVIAG